jgi:hypothetical protein
MLARTRPDSNLLAATGEEGEVGNRRAAAIGVLALETCPTVVQGAATLTEEVEGTALAIDKSRIPGARQTGARLVEHRLG